MILGLADNLMTPRLFRKNRQLARMIYTSGLQRINSPQRRLRGEQIAGTPCLPPNGKIAIEARLLARQRYSFHAFRVIGIQSLGLSRPHSKTQRIEIRVDVEVVDALMVL